MPVPGVIMPKEVVIEGEEAGDVAALGLLRPAGVSGYLGGVVECRQGDEVLGRLFFSAPKHYVLNYFRR
jgi:hypothetical protein